MFSEFDKALVEFERDAYSLLHECRFDAGKNPSSFNVQIQAQSLATDIGYLSMVMRDLHEAAIRDVSDKLRPEKTPEFSLAHAKLGAAFKAFLFPVRSYQDAIYKIGLCIAGQRIGGKSSMTNAVNVKVLAFVQGNPVAELLEVAIPEYPAWFASLRGQRDFIKYGAGISYSSEKNFITGKTSVAVKLHTSSENKPSISLDDVSKALRMSTKVTMAVIEAGIKNGTLNPRVQPGTAGSGN